MKEVTFIITDITNGGGTERTTCNLANTLVSKGYSVGIVSLFKGAYELKFKLDSAITILYCRESSYESSMGVLLKIKLVLNVLLQLKKRVKKRSERIIITQTFMPAFLVWICGDAKQSIVCEHFNYYNYNKFVCMIRDQIYSKFRQLILLTADEIDLYQKTVKNISVIPNMVMPQEIRADIDSKTIVAVGRLTYQKGFDMLIDAAKIVWKHSPAYSIVIYGNGELDVELREKIISSDLSDVIKIENFTDDIISVISKSSIFVMSSRFEGLPMVLLEAMSIGMPIVSFDCPTGPRILLGNDVGILVEPDNVEKLADGIISLINNTNLRLQLSELSLNRISKYYPDKIYYKWKAVL